MFTLNFKSRILELAAIMAVCTATSGCSANSGTSDKASSNDPQASYAVTEISVASASPAPIDKQTEAGMTEQGSDNLSEQDLSDTTTLAQVKTTEISAPSFSYSDIPEYSGSPYVEINGNIPYFTDYPDKDDVFELYSPLDDLGRCGVAYANICEKLMPTEPRGEIGSVKPTGWHTANYHDYIEDIYLYNRCHLIGFQLAGENANEQNLITGTRYMNVDGMETFENKVANYVKSNNANVLYRVTPVFKGDELVARGVLMEGYSLADNGQGICFCVFCYNVQPHIGIDYATGESWVLDDAVTTTTTSTTTANPVQTETKKTVVTKKVSSQYILNTNTKKFHSPSCSSVDQIKDKNKSYFDGTREEAISMGYSPCKRCNP